MSDQDWSVRTFGDVATLEYGAALPAAARSGDEFPVFGSNGEVGRNESALVQGPGIIVGRKGTVGALAWSPADFWPIDTSYYVEARRGVDKRWLYWAMSALGLGRLDSSTGVPGLNRNDAYGLQLKVPPVKEQRRIAEILDTLDDQIRLTREIVAKLEAARRGAIGDLLTRGIEALRPGGGSVSLVRPNWREGHLVRWCDRMTVGVVNSATHAYAEEGVPFIRSQNVKPNHIDEDGMLFVTEAYNKSKSSSILCAGDVIVVRTGYPGTAAVVSAQLSGSNCFSLLVASPRKSDLNAEFLALYLNSEFAKAQIGRMQFGSAQHNLNLGQLKRLLVRIPPLEEQVAIVDVAHAWESMIDREMAILLKLQREKSGLSDDLLSGRVRIPEGSTS